jgi:hypothetical protein
MFLMALPSMPTLIYNLLNGNYIVNVGGNIVVASCMFGLVCEKRDSIISKICCIYFACIAMPFSIVFN